MFKTYLQKKVLKQISGERQLILDHSPPTKDELHLKFQKIDELGIYLHIPFCRQICPYCPYNKELYQSEIVKRYTASVLREIDYYASIVGNRPVTTFYIGGGTPTVMIGNGIETIIGYVYKSFNMKCFVHMESHPNDLSAENLNILKSVGVKYLSIGVEALQDRHLKMLHRPYSALEVRLSVERAVKVDFDCVNVDFIFALPGQTCLEVEQAAHELVGMGIHQAATYPLFRFPYTQFGQSALANGSKMALLFKRRKMLKILEHIFYDAGFERSSVWAFTKKGTEKYCSVTVPLYIGLGASGASYLNDVFFLNTFNVAAYIESVEQKKMPVALALNLTENMQMAGWLYWRIYESKFNKSDFFNRFGVDFDKKYGRLMNILSSIGYLRNDGQQIVLSESGAYWLHAFEDWFSIDFINRLWGNSKKIPWPQKVILVAENN